MKPNMVQSSQPSARCIYILVMAAAFVCARLTLAQAWFFWAAVAVLGMLLIGGMTSSLSWLWPQRSNELAKIQIFLLTISSIWVCEQLFDIIMLPLLSIRSFHGSAHKCEMWQFK
jgi:hypothetical protein